MKHERLEQLEQYILTHQVVRTNEICEKFGISKNTFHKDLNELAQRGNIVKVYGGAKAAETSRPAPLSIRNTQRIDEKAYVATLVAKYIQDGDVIFLDTGSTILHLIPLLSTRKNLTVVTHSLAAMYELSKYPSINIIGTGGVFSSYSQSFLGTSALDTLKDMQIPKIILSPTGVSIQHGVMYTTMLEAEFKRKLISKGSEIYLLVDSLKIGHLAPMSVCPLSQAKYFFTNKQPPVEYFNYLKESKIHIVY